MPRTFTYANNLFSYINDARFQGFISDIDKNEHCIHVQPVRYQEHIETLMEELEYKITIHSNLSYYYFQSFFLVHTIQVQYRIGF